MVPPFVLPNSPQQLIETLWRCLSSIHKSVTLKIQSSVLNIRNIMLHFTDPILSQYSPKHGATYKLKIHLWTYYLSWTPISLYSFQILSWIERPWTKRNKIFLLNSVHVSRGAGTKSMTVKYVSYQDTWVHYCLNT